jgi:hypothetical protein
MVLRVRTCCQPRSLLRLGSRVCQPAVLLELLSAVPRSCCRVSSLLPVAPLVRRHITQRTEIYYDPDPQHSVRRPSVVIASDACSVPALLRCPILAPNLLRLYVDSLLFAVTSRCLVTRCAPSPLSRSSTSCPNRSSRRTASSSRTTLTFPTRTFPSRTRGASECWHPGLCSPHVSASVVLCGCAPCCCT